MSSSHSFNGGPTSEASRLLEAALEQMDGIIQGARFELPTYGSAAGKSPTKPRALATFDLTYDRVKCQWPFATRLFVTSLVNWPSAFKN